MYLILSFVSITDGSDMNKSKNFVPISDSNDMNKPKNVVPIAVTVNYYKLISEYHLFYLLYL